MIVIMTKEIEVVVLENKKTYRLYLHVRFSEKWEKKIQPILSLYGQIATNSHYHNVTMLMKVKSFSFVIPV